MNISNILIPGLKICLFTECSSRCIFSKSFSLLRRNRYLVLSRFSSSVSVWFRIRFLCLGSLIRVKMFLQSSGAANPPCEIAESGVSIESTEKGNIQSTSERTGDMKPLPPSKYHLISISRQIFECANISQRRTNVINIK